VVPASEVSAATVINPPFHTAPAATDGRSATLFTRRVMRKRMNPAVSSAASCSLLESPKSPAISADVV